MPETFDDFLQRSEILFGETALEKLKNARILLAGAGGVGGYAAEALARGGTGHLTVYDPDCVHPTNLNRQILALHSNNGRQKTAVLAERIYDINPGIDLQVHPERLSRENIGAVLEQGNFDYIADAIDSLDDKCFLLVSALKKQIPVISAMGAGCRFDPTRIQYSDISRTYGCKLAKSIRSKLKKEYNITKGIMCVFSPEVNPGTIQPAEDGERPLIGSNSFIPGIFGLFMAAKVINDIASRNVNF